MFYLSNLPNLPVDLKNMIMEIIKSLTYRRGGRDGDGEERIISLGKKNQKIIQTQPVLTRSPFAVLLVLTGL